MKNKHKIAYMKAALAFSECSNATRLKVGAVIVKDNNIIATGYNAQAEHINDPCELEDGTTDPRVRHAEKNALMSLIRSHESSVGATMFCTHSCCLSCCIDIIDSGIKHFIYLTEYRDLKGIYMLQQHGITVEKLTLN